MALFSARPAASLEPVFEKEKKKKQKPLGKNAKISTENQHIWFNFQHDIFVTTTATNFAQIQAMKLPGEKLGQKGFVREDTVLC